MIEVDRIVVTDPALVRPQDVIMLDAITFEQPE